MALEKWDAARGGEMLAEVHRDVTCDQTGASTAVSRRHRVGRTRRAEFVVAIDTREHLPYEFARSEVKTLASGDYSIVGLEDHVAIERKSKADAYASLGRDRARFEREVERLSRLDYAAIVIEASLPEFLQAPTFSHMNPKAAARTIIAWSVKYGVHVFFAGDRRLGQALTSHLLEKYAWYYGGQDARRAEGDT